MWKCAKSWRMHEQLGHRAARSGLPPDITDRFCGWLNVQRAVGGIEVSCCNRECNDRAASAADYVESARTTTGNAFPLQPEHRHHIDDDLRARVIHDGVTIDDPTPIIARQYW